MNMKPVLLLGCLCAALTAHGQGTTLLISPSSVDLTIGPYVDRATFTFPTPSVSLANYGGASVTFSAPAGYAWRFDPSMASGLECYIAYGAQLSGVHGGTPYTFDFVPGMESTIMTSPSDLTAWDSETSFGFDQVFHFAGIAEFTGFTVTTGHSVTQDEYDRQTPMSPFDHAYLNGSSGNLNGGLTLVPIPEPSVAALAVLGAATFCRRFRAKP